MIRVVMLGRTGNNLFQYAAARALAERRGAEVWLDASTFDDEGWRSVSCISRLALKARVTRLHPWLGRASRKLLDRHPWELFHRPVWREDDADLSFDGRLLDCPGDCVLRGYFQTWRYFAGIEERLRSELDLNALDWDPVTRGRAECLEKAGSVAVHVRRTDYVENPNVGFLSEQYYRRAVKRMRSRVPGARFHVFSDDPDGVTAWFDGPVQVERPEVGDPLRDLFLMSRARHHVIANSSYSWWAAWLGQKPGQVVLMPSEWSRGGMISPIGEKQWPGWERLAVA